MTAEEPGGQPAPAQDHEPEREQGHESKRVEGPVAREARGGPGRSTTPVRAAKSATALAASCRKAESSWARPTGTCTISSHRRAAENPGEQIPADEGIAEPSGEDTAPGEQQLGDTSPHDRLDRDVREPNE